MATVSLGESALPPFPKGLPTIELPKISLRKLLKNDDAEAQKMFDICTRTGFFYLDLMDDPVGQALWNSALLAREAGKVMAELSMEEKDKFLKRPEVGILDRGFQSTIRDEHGQTKFVESCNIPRDELFAPTPTSYQLPLWLEKSKNFFETVMKEGNVISNIILAVFERQLQLASGTLTSCHQLSDPSHSFLRILRYPALQAGQTLGGRFFPHRDIVSIAILITWLGGLQIPEEGAAIDEKTGHEVEESWRWLEPLPGYAIVNLGDAMPIFTNNRLKSGKHRIYTAPGEQARVDRYSVLLGTRPAHQTPMKAFKSPLIPESISNGTVVSCKIWGDQCVKDFIEAEVKKVRGGA